MRRDFGVAGLEELKSSEDAEQNAAQDVSP